jgi:hypothetical protein
MLTPEQVAVRAQWTAALRSGAYQQGNGRLRGQWPGSPHEGFCCLGVLCDVVAPTGWERRRSAYISKVDYFHEGAYDVPVPSVCRAAGLPDGDDPDIHSFLGELTEANDVEGLTFEEIADVIDLDTRMQLDEAA